MKNKKWRKLKKNSYFVKITILWYQQIAELCPLLMKVPNKMPVEGPDFSSFLENVFVWFHWNSLVKIRKCQTPLFLKYLVIGCQKIKFFDISAKITLLRRTRKQENRKKLLFCQNNETIISTKIETLPPPLFYYLDAVWFH